MKKKFRIPTFNDGICTLYRISEDNEVVVGRQLTKLFDVWYEELSVSDSRKSQLMANGIEVTTRIRIPQYKQLNSEYILEIAGKKHKVYNAYHFENNEGFELTDITLTNWEGEYE